MCLAIPSRIVELSDVNAVVDVMGARRQVNLMLLPEEAVLGDYVLVHAGFAIQKVDQDAAQEALKVISALVDEMGRDEDGLPMPEAPGYG